MPEPDDRAVIEQLNVEIGDAEDRGDSVWLDGVLAPQLAFRRANGQIVNREEYLQAVAPGGPRETQVESTVLFGDRAVVTCIVTIRSARGDQRYHNVRLLVRHEEKWKVLGWANEPL
jgi:Domain of unknown function (DUF4440)